VLTGGWLTSESDSTAYRLGNPGGGGRPRACQLGFDLWVARVHRALPVVPTADAGGALAALSWPRMGCSE
jgi:hypothetical protein